MAFGSDFMGLFGSCTVFTILKNRLLMFKIQKISLKIHKFLASIKNVKGLVTMDPFCSLTVVGLSWWGMWTLVCNNPQHILLSLTNYCHIESGHPNIEAECQLPFFCVLSVSLNYLLVLTHLPGVYRYSSLVLALEEWFFRLRGVTL